MEPTRPPAGDSCISVSRRKLWYQYPYCCRYGRLLNEIFPWRWVCHPSFPVWMRISFVPKEVGSQYRFQKALFLMGTQELNCRSSSRYECVTQIPRKWIRPNPVIWFSSSREIYIAVRKIRTHATVNYWSLLSLTKITFENVYRRPAYLFLPLFILLEQIQKIVVGFSASAATSILLVFLWSLYQSSVPVSAHRDMAMVI